MSRIAKRYGFVGRVEYRHVFSNSGGAQFGLGTSADGDLLVVYAEAFLRDGDPADFTLSAIIAHERGHQIACRNDRLQSLLAGRDSPVAEEILASLVGSFIVQDEADSRALILKALDDMVQCGLALDDALELVTDLRALLKDVI